MLKTGTRVQNVSLIDNIFKTCCALHNRLLEIDGMDVPWENGVSCDYLDQNFHDFDDKEIPNAIHELCQDYGPLPGIDFFTTGTCNTFVHDNFMTGRNSDDEGSEQSDEDAGSALLLDENGAVCVNTMSLDDFRSKLVIHFDILFKKKALVWPKRAPYQMAL